MTVKATRLGRVGHLTASGYVVEQFTPYVALPTRAALYRLVDIVNPHDIDPATRKGRSIRAIVLDVGPWNTRDEAYVFGGARPKAESGIDEKGRATNGAGIDLGEAVWNALRMFDNGDVTWSFVDLP